MPPGSAPTLRLGQMSGTVRFAVPTAGRFPQRSGCHLPAGQMAANGIKRSVLSPGRFFRWVTAVASSASAPCSGSPAGFGEREAAPSVMATGPAWRGSLAQRPRYPLRPLEFD